MYHNVWDHNALRKGFFKEFADSDEKIVAATGLSLEDVIVLRSQLEA